jgi:exopolyphosphatase/guanosine-5'-triphosphate,3'-diphosphate pyrophosphatase
MRLCVLRLVRYDRTMVSQEYSHPAREGQETVYGALDLGTNNCRLLLAVPKDDGFHVVDAFSRITRLGEGLAASGMLSPSAMARTLSALGFCADKLKRRRVGRLRAVATEACRRAANCRDFLAKVRAETGLDLEIISAQEEATLALAGCAPLLAPWPVDALVFDIGGGSTELIGVRCESGDTRIMATLSLPFGVVTLAEQEGAALRRADGFQQIVTRLLQRLRRFDPDGRLAALAADGRLQMLGSSGTVTTLAGIHLELARYDRARVDGVTLDFSVIESISQTLQQSSIEQRVSHPCIGRDRADLVVAGCAILAAICRLWPAGRLRVADRGVREGLLLSMMRDDRRMSRT